MKVYKALRLSLLIYAAPEWQPWAAPSCIEQLEHCQNKALRVVTRQLKPPQLKRSDVQERNSGSLHCTGYNQQFTGGTGPQGSN